MSNSSINIRRKALEVYQKLDSLASKYVKHQTLKSFLDWILRPRIYNLIQFTVPEQELKQILLEAYYEIRPLAEEFQLGTQIKEAEKLGSPKIARIGNVKEVMDLIEQL